MSLSSTCIERPALPVVLALLMLIAGAVGFYFLQIEGENTELSIRTLGLLTTPESFNNLIVKREDGEIIRFSEIGHAILGSENERTICKEFLNPSIAIGVVPQPGANTIAIVDEFFRRSEQIVKEMPPGYNVRIGFDFTSFERKSIKEVQETLVLAFVRVILIIYLILAAQFDNFIDPIVILVTVPLALFGALLSLWYFDQTLNIFSQIGMIMLIGLVTKNGILIVEFAQQRKKMGESKIEAVEKAAISRLRPILMTAFSTIFGILPVALALGSSSGSRQSLGIAVIGGLIFATFLAVSVTFIVVFLFSGWLPAQPFAQAIYAFQAYNERKSLRFFSYRPISYLRKGLLLIAGVMVYSLKASRYF